MVISEEKLDEIIKQPNANIEKITTLSDDGKSLLTRIPKEIVTFLKLKRGDLIRWLVKSDKSQINLEVLKNENQKKEDN